MRMTAKILTILGIVLSVVGALLVVEIPAGKLLRIPGVWGGGDKKEKDALEKDVKRTAALARVFLIAGGAYQCVAAYLPN